MFCTMLTRGLGFVRTFVFSHYFGNKGLADVVNAAFSIPNSLRMLFAEGALSSAFIPTLSSSLVEDPTGTRARQIVRNLFAFILLILLPLIGFAALFPDKVIGVLIYFKEPEKMALSAELFRWICWYLLLISISAILMGALNARRLFFVPAITPVLFSVTVIFSVMFLPIRLEYRMVVGILSGGLAQVFFQMPSFLRARYDLKPDFRLKNPDFIRILIQWLPVVVSASVFSINQLVANLFASGLDEGSVSAFQYAIVYFQFPMGIFANSTITVMFPRMSRQVASKDIEGLKETLQYGLRFILILLVPSALGLIFLGENIIALTLQHGAFTVEGTLMTSSVLTGLALGLFSTGAFTLFQRLFYALKDYIRPLITALVVLSLDVGLSLILKETPLRVTGLAVASSIAFTVGFILMTILARRKLGSLKMREFVTAAVKVAIANIPLAAILILLNIFLRPLLLGSNVFLQVGVLLLAIAVCFGVTLVMYLVLKIDIVDDIIKKRFKKRGN
jgi:putative peptidoglycan lipid II flippase